MEKEEFKTKEEFKVQCWNEFIKQDKQLIQMANEGEISLFMANIMPNDFEHITKVCHGGYEGVCFDSYADFIKRCMDYEQETGGGINYYKFGDAWFVIDANGFAVSDATADGMIRYVIENIGLDWGDWDKVEERFNAFYKFKLESKIFN